MDPIGHLCFDVRPVVNGIADDVEHPAEDLVPHGDGDLRPFIYCILAPFQSVGGVHCNAADSAVADMLGHFKDKVLVLIVDGRVRHKYCSVYWWKVIGWKPEIHDRPDDLYNLSPDFHAH
ncbi:MAG: hypothetical protein A4E64_00872 [Syntrophorhabdus sp. PtaU1.Bin058]|nr:MAG: hypothetical protein A4E64_00872 [Syntrophorhabdus sp. PtaU1.Bin058]